LKACADENACDEDRHQAIGEAAERIASHLGLPEPDLGVVMALLYAGVDGFGLRVRQRARHYLSGEPLTEFDHRFVPELPSHSGDMLLRPMMVSLTRVVASAGSGPFIYFFDQAEALWALGPGAASQALQVIADFLDSAERAVVVIALEKVQHQTGYLALPRFLRDRFDNGLQTELGRERSEAEVRDIVAARFAAAMREAGIEQDPENPLFPLPKSWAAEHARRQTRVVLSEARMDVERLLGHAPQPTPPNPVDIETVDTRWKAVLDSIADVPEEDAEVLALLAWACGAARFEGMTAKTAPIAAESEPVFVDIAISGGPATGDTRAFLFSGATQGGRMLARVNTAIQRKGHRRAVAVRLENFPTNPATQTAQRLVELISPNGTRVQPTPDELRRLEAYRRFLAQEAGRPGVADWAHQASIIEDAPCVARILGVDGEPSKARRVERDHSRAAPVPSSTMPDIAVDSEAVTTSDASAAPLAHRLRIGHSDGGSEVQLDARALLKHAAVLGGSGSGKTTFILNIVEELAMLGVPSVIVDRKGDVASYADSSSWTPAGDSEADARRKRLRDRLEPAVFTPAKNAGRPLAIRLLPADVSDLADDDRREAARSAADALSDMIGLKASGKDGQRREVLAQAVAQAAEDTGSTLDLAGLVTRLHDGAPGLENLLRYLDPQARLRKDLAPRLEQLRLGRGELFDASGEQLDFAALLHSGAGRVRMSVISLAFIPEVHDQQFFVSRLLAEARRYCRQQPSSNLQGVLVLDEADLYMPAQSNPATKAPMLDLLRRARSGGLGIILGTQSPADLDYKGRDNIATWALGRIQTKTAIDKVTFASEGTDIDLAALLPTFMTGKFYLKSEGLALQVQGRRSLIETRQLSQESILAAAQTR
jgi:molybdopterin-guanine dinucleotide biosynthesis protein